METLSQEKFNTLKELADVQTNVALCRAELLKLKETTEEYMVVREKEAEDRVTKVLKESREALDETTNNQRELLTYNKELQAYANELKKSAFDIMTLFEDFGRRMKEADEDLKEGQIHVTELLTKIKIERVQVQEDRKLLQGEREEMTQANRLLDDRRKALERAWAELKKLKANK